MYIEFEHPTGLLDRLRDIEVREDDHLLVLLAKSAADQIDDLVAELENLDAPCFGAVFPALIDGREIRDRGAIALPVSLLRPPSVVPLEGDDFELPDTLPIVSELSNESACLILVDYSCIGVTTLLEELFDNYGDAANYFGAGVGTASQGPEHILFANGQSYRGAALIAVTNSAVDAQLRHGWTRNSEPMIATKTEGNIVKELNWEPAMTVYRALVGDQVANSLEHKNTAPEAKRYPFGIARDDLEDIVRDPVRATETGELVVLSGVPEHSVMRILKGDNENLITAAQQLGTDFGRDKSADQCIVFDCYSRAMLLGQDIQRELSSFADEFWENRPNTKLVGALALGEIASDGQRTPDFQNKTIAAGLIPRGD